MTTLAWVGNVSDVVKLYERLKFLNETLRTRHVPMTEKKEKTEENLQFSPVRQTLTNSVFVYKQSAELLKRSTMPNISKNSKHLYFWTIQ